LEIVWQNKAKQLGDKFVKTPLILVYRIAQFFLKVKDILNDKTIQKYFPSLLKALMEILSDRTKDDLKVMDKGIIEKSLKILG